MQTYSRFITENSILSRRINFETVAKCFCPSPQPERIKTTRAMIGNNKTYVKRTYATAAHRRASLHSKFPFIFLRRKFIEETKKIIEGPPAIWSGTSMLSIRKNLFPSIFMPFFGGLSLRKKLKFSIKKNQQNVDV